MLNLSWQQVALVAVVLAGVIGASALGGPTLVASLVGIVVAGLGSLGGKGTPPAAP